MKWKKISTGFFLAGLACLCGCSNMDGAGGGSENKPESPAGHVMAVPVGGAPAGVSLTPVPTAVPVANLAPRRGSAVAAVVVAQSPKLDKLLDDPMWQQAPVLKLASLGNGATVPKTTARMLFDKKFMYVAFDCEDPDTGAIKKDCTERDSSVWEDDCVEVFISPDPAKSYKHIVINAANVICDEDCDGNWRNAAWNANLWSVVAIETNQRWRVAMAIPLQDLGVTVGANQTWRFNLNRTRPERNGLPLVEYSWAELPGHDYHAPDAFVALTGVNIVANNAGGTAAP
jgi:hypothetical protein